MDDATMTTNETVGATETESEHTAQAALVLADELAAAHGARLGMRNPPAPAGLERADWRARDLVVCGVPRTQWMRLRAAGFTPAGRCDARYGRDSTLDAVPCPHPDHWGWHGTREMVAPAVGVPATIYVGSDSYAATVTAVSASGHRVTLSNTIGGSETATLRPDGAYRLLGRRGGLVAFGFARDYRDPSF
jgi:hypothetical protein